MSQIGFFCPDGQKVLFEDCFKQCRMNCRCVSLPTLRAAAVQRPWTGLPSTTQLLAGTRYALLKIMKDYYEDVQKLAWILLGNTAHKGLENADLEGTAELEFKNQVMSGKIDWYDQFSKTLWDYKTSGSYKVHKALGLVQSKIDSPNDERYQKGGKGYKAGDIKKVAIWTPDAEKSDKWEWVLQTNRYAIWLKEDDKPVEHIMIEVIVRDGGLMAARNYGVDKNIIIIEIPILNKDYVLDYFNRKRKMLLKAIALSWAPKCNSLESWEGRKCDGYCPVSEECNKMPDDHKSYKEFIKLEPQILC